MPTSLMVYAKTDVQRRAEGMTAFPGRKAAFCRLLHGSHLDKLGMRGSNTYPLVLRRLRSTGENVLGGVGNGTKVLMSGLDYTERAILSGGPLGIMAACMDVVVPLFARPQAVRSGHW